MERKAAHLAGEWHRTFHCWVVSGSPKPSLLFQLRSAAMESFPDTLDVSAAGHLEAGESVAEGVREVREELGVDFDDQQLHPLGDRVEVADQVNGQRNREYQSVYLLRLDAALESYTPQVSEVAGLLWLPLDHGLRLFAGESQTAPTHGIAYNAEGEEWLAVNRVVREEDFLPRIQRYYLSVAIMAERLLEDRFPLAIS